MAEDIKGTTQVTAEPQERDWVSEAKEMGWREDYSGNGRKLSPQEWVERRNDPVWQGKKIDKLTKDLRQAQEALRHQMDMQTRILSEVQGEKLAKLTKAKEEAIRSADPDKVKEVEDQISKTMELPKGRNTPRELEEFVERNKWYSNDPHMKAWADARGPHLANVEKKSPGEVLAQLEREVRDVFPHKFESKRSNEVEGGRAHGRSGDQEDVTLPKEYERFAQSYWKAGAFGQVSWTQAKRIYMDQIIALEKKGKR